MQFDIINVQQEHRLRIQEAQDALRKRKFLAQSESRSPLWKQLLHQIKR